MAKPLGQYHSAHLPEPFLPADTAGREEEPIHEDSRAVVIRVVRQQSVPLVLLLTCAVSAASWGFGFAASSYSCSKPPTILKIPAYLLVNCLLKLLVIQNCSHLPVAVARPVRRNYLHLGLAHILPWDHNISAREGWVTQTYFSPFSPPLGLPGKSAWRFCLSA